MVPPFAGRQHFLASIHRSRFGDARRAHGGCGGWVFGRFGGRRRVRGREELICWAARSGLVLEAPVVVTAAGWGRFRRRPDG